VDSTISRVLVLVVVLGVAAVLALLARRTRPHHPPVTIDNLDLPAGIVMFTSTDCPRCRDVLDIAKGVDAPLREITYELEGDLQRRAGVVGVPLTLVISGSGALIAQMPGRFSRRSLLRALGRAGL